MSRKLILGRSRRRSKRVLSVIAAVVVVPCLVIWRDLPAEALVVRDTPLRTDAAMVFGGDPHFERTAHASRLYLDGMTDLLILCGGEAGPGDDAKSLLAHAQGLGVPREKMVIEGKSTSTWESILYARPIFEQLGVRSLTLVTSPYHQRRAFLVARRFLGDKIKLINSPANPSFWSPNGWWTSRRDVRIVFREYGKLAYYFLRRWI